VNSSILLFDKFLTSWRGIMEDLTITILIFDNLTALDAVGPFEVLSKIPGAKIQFASLTKGAITCRGGLKIIADYSIYDIKETDILLVPGGKGINDLLTNDEILYWIRQLHSNTKYTVSVCTGALLLASAGLLKGVKATTYWNSAEKLKSYGVEFVKSRFVVDGKIITSAGVSAGIDMSLKLAAMLDGEPVAKIIQLAIEYDPEPPFNAGSPDKISKTLLEAFHRVNSQQEAEEK
jgi:transcriptional regulator GlxA family with amidase domain